LIPRAAQTTGAADPATTEPNKGGSFDAFFHPPQTLRPSDKAVAKTRQIQIDIEIKRKTRIPIDDVLVAHNELFKNTVGNLKAYRNKILTQDLFNEIMAIGVRSQRTCAISLIWRMAKQRLTVRPGLPWPDRPV
jgi:hypothetical protein